MMTIASAHTQDREQAVDTSSKASSRQGSPTASTTPATSKQQQQNLRDWVLEIARKLLVARGIKTDADRIILLCDWLAHDGYTMEQRHKAELWILRGDWSKRGHAAILEYSDFFPTPAQWESLIDGSVVLSRQAYRLRIENARREGMDYARALDRQAAVEKAEEGSGMFRVEYVKTLREVDTLHRLNADLQRKISDLAIVADWRLKAQDMEQAAIASQHALKLLRAETQAILADPQLYQRKRADYLHWLSQARNSILTIENASPISENG